mgnify:CR=1 FL=1
MVCNKERKRRKKNIILSHLRVYGSQLFFFSQFFFFFLYMNAVFLFIHSTNQLYKFLQRKKDMTKIFSVYSFLCVHITAAYPSQLKRFSCQCPILIRLQLSIRVSFWWERHHQHHLLPTPTTSTPNDEWEAMINLISWSGFMNKSKQAADQPTNQPTATKMCMYTFVLKCLCLWQRGQQC